MTSISARPCSVRRNSTSSELNLQQVLNAAAVLGVSRERYSAYAGKRWGPGWKINAAGRRHALAEIESYRDDRQGFADKINAALDVLS